MPKKRILSTLCLCLLLASKVWGGGVRADLLVYGVEEVDTEPYTSRIFVTSRYLRMDQGSGNPGFILFDRSRRVAYSVTPEDRTVLVIQPPPRPVEQRDPGRLRAVPDPEFAAPKVGGVTPRHFRYRIGTLTCRNAVVLPGLLSSVVEALAEYRQLLADQEAVSLEGIPADMRSECGDALDLYDPVAELHQGLPLRIWDERRKEQLIDYRRGEKVAASLFRLPGDYTRIHLDPGASER